MKEKYRIQWCGRSLIATMLVLMPLTGFSAVILGPYVINDIRSVGNGETLVIQTNPSPLAVANLIVGAGSGNTGQLNVSSGGDVVIDGTPDMSAAGVYPGMSIARQSGSIGSVQVTGTGSTLTVKGNSGFLNVAGSSTSDNGTGSLEVTNGGVVSGAGGANDFVLLNVGGGMTTSGTGTVLISGPGSSIQLRGAFGPGTGVDEGGGAVVNIGRGSGSGTVNVTNGGLLSLDTTGVPLTAFGPSINIGRHAGSTGQLNIDGAGSRVVITSDSLSPFVSVGRAGVGSLTVTNGALLQMNGFGESTIESPNLNQLNIGGSAGVVGGTGTATVSGSGSRIELNGTADRFVFVGRGTGSTGTLNVQDGGSVRSLYALVGSDGGTGTLTLDSGSLDLQGVGTGGLAAGLGAGLGVGRGTGSLGTVSVVNGSSVTIDATGGMSGGILIGGTTTAAGGTGTMNVLSGSTVTVKGSSTGSGVFVGANAGTGTMTVGGAGTTVDVSGVSDGGRIIIGANSGAVGTMTVTDSASVNAGALLGVAHDGVVQTGGTGSLKIGAGAVVDAAKVHLGSAGVISGAGTLIGDVVNHGGLISAGNTPGVLTIDGDYSGTGTFLIEIEAIGTGFAVDTVNFTKLGANLDFSDSIVEFLFLGATNPEDFLVSALNSIESFFAFDDSAIVDFDGTVFTARAESFVITSFAFSVEDGFTSLEVARVPEPGSLLLILLGLAGLAIRRGRPASNDAGVREMQMA